MIQLFQCGKFERYIYLVERNFINVVGKIRNFMFACITVPLVCPLFPREKLFNALIDPAVNYLVKTQIRFICGEKSCKL